MKVYLLGKVSFENEEKTLWRITCPISIHKSKEGAEEKIGESVTRYCPVAIEEFELED